MKGSVSSPISHGITLLCFLLAASASSAQDFRPPPVKLTIQVVDEDGVPIEQADAGATFRVFDAQTQRMNYLNRHALTNEMGRVVAAEKSSDSAISYGAKKAGYYKTTGLRFDLQQKAAARWQPWNPTVTVVLKRIGKPIPMYAKRVEVKIPEDASAVGFDLQAADWVAPYGKGMVGDFIFTVNRTITSDRDYRATLQLTFSNAGDGVVPLRDVKNLGSELLLPRTAPEDGYEAKRTWTQSRAPNASGPDTFSKPSDTKAYFFRVRSVLDDKGRVKSALYGKVPGDISLYVGTKAPKAGLGFTYYLNPTANDRNVEFDPKKNLFTGLKGLESVRAP